ncbi:PH domain-containing protein [Streptomyces sp. NEAU-Y11]|uniref:PH domain-containing protein n=1 Tax=Streptomyces cucumeris TaxID=2962890 RepID=UPI0020C903D4|nr:PH domain-containing protein [Streptomyces sp. NEAU-Y11]MCP9207426.1 PH domain-containing protein [Streptomyces sp. NEAU-Y11]
MTAAPPDTAQATAPATEWRSLDPRTVAVHLSWLAAPLGSLGLTALATHGRLDTRAWITLGCIAAGFAVITTGGLLRWWRTRYRITADAFELRTGLFTRRLRAIPLHRVRNVDLTAHPVQRLLGLTVLRAGTTADGATGGSALTLEALTRPDAERLRAELLARAGSADTTGEPVLSTVDRRWLRYAPLTFWIFGGVFAVLGTVWRVLGDIGVEPWRIGVVRDAFREFGHSALWLTVPLALLGIAAVGSLGAVVLYAENWWKYRLERTDADTLRVRRGLLTTRSVSFERSRLRGAVLREPLLLRLGGGATVRAVAGGLGSREENCKRSQVLPPAPRAEALRVAAAVATPGPGDGAPALFDRPALRPHPPAARRRRTVRGMVWAVLPGTAALTVLGALLTPVLLYCALGYALLAVPLVLVLARDAHRSLGHGVTGRHLLIRSGTFSRDTVALAREAVLAWSFTDSPLTRRAGLTTVTAAVAAGQDGYRAPDMAAGDAVPFAAAAAPGILDEFLAGDPDGAADPLSPPGRRP